MATTMAAAAAAAPPRERQQRRRRRRPSPAALAHALFEQHDQAAMFKVLEAAKDLPQGYVLEAIQEMLLLGAVVDARDAGGATLLHRAVERAPFAVAMLLMVRAVPVERGP